VRTSYNGCRKIVDHNLNLNGDYCVEKAEVNHYYEVKTAGVQQVLIAHCGAFAGRRLNHVLPNTLPNALISTNMKRMLPLTSSIGGSCTSKSLKRLHGPYQRTLSSSQSTASPASNMIQTEANEYVTTEGVIEGTIIFHNPYGYIPGQLFGLLPFEVRIRFASLLEHFFSLLSLFVLFTLGVSI
jgi:hypothetical protein